MTVPDSTSDTQAPVDEALEAHIAWVEANLAAGKEWDGSDLPPARLYPGTPRIAHWHQLGLRPEAIAIELDLNIASVIEVLNAYETFRSAFDA